MSPFTQFAIFGWFHLRVYKILKSSTLFGEIGVFTQPSLVNMCATIELLEKGDENILGWVIATKLNMNNLNMENLIWPIASCL